MKIRVCDHCGCRGRASKSDPGPNVVEVRAGLENGGRILDLCGDCRKEFNALVNHWLGVADGGDHEWLVAENGTRWCHRCGLVASPGEIAGHIPTPPCAGTGMPAGVWEKL